MAIANSALAEIILRKIFLTALAKVLPRSVAKAVMISFFPIRPKPRLSSKNLQLKLEAIDYRSTNFNHEA